MRSRTPFRTVAFAAAAGGSALLLGCSAVSDTLQTAVPIASTVVETASQWPDRSAEAEARQAQQNARQLEDSVPIWEDPLLDPYLSEITNRLVAVVREDGKDRGFTFRVRVIEDPTINAMTLGGGFVYVHAGLIARMENEAQLATVLAHEIAHNTEEHVSGSFADIGIPVGVMLGTTAAEETGVLTGEALSQAYQYTMLAAVNGHGRSKENEADEVGLDYLVRAGYDPREAPRTFEQIVKEYGDDSPLRNFFWGSHPTAVSRFERLSELARTRYGDETSSRRLLVNTEEFQRRTRELVLRMGVTDFRENRFELAQAMFEKARAVEEGDSIPHYYLGRIALETTRGEGEVEAETAIRHFRRATEVAPTFAPAYRELGIAHYRHGDREEAIAALERYLELEPEAEDAERVRRMIAELRRY